jgi:hypothetical protein
LRNAIHPKQSRFPFAEFFRQNTTVNPEFVNAAMDAVRQWRYSPVLLNGEPVETLTSITLDFKLQP